MGMNAIRIRARIWLSIGIFVLGFLLATVLWQIGSRSAEQDLGTISDSLVPAVKDSHDAQSAFQGLIEAYAHVTATERSTELATAELEGNRVIAALHGIAARKGLAPRRVRQAANLAQATAAFQSQALLVYLKPHLDQTTERFRRLADETARLRSELQDLAAGLESDLNHDLQQLRLRTTRLRLFTLALFGTTLAVATFLVDAAIKRAILEPLSKAEAELTHERDLLRVLLDHVPDCIYFKDTTGHFIRISKAAAELFGVTEEAVCGRRVADFLDLPTADDIRVEEERILSCGRPLIAKIEEVRRKGLHRWLNTTKVPVRGKDGKFDLLIGISRDITESREAIAQLERSEASFRQLFAAIPHAVWVCDLETQQILEVNTAAVHQYGYSPEEFRAMRLAELYPVNDRQRLQRCLANRHADKGLGGLRKHVTKGGRILEVEIAKHHLDLHGRTAILLLAQDVTERKQLEIELQHAQRLESIGRLAAGIAHEINTPVQYIGDNLRFLQDAFLALDAVLGAYEEAVNGSRAGIRPQALEAIAKAKGLADSDYLASEIPRAFSQSAEGVERVAGIVKAMKAFAHPGQSEKAPADLNEALANALIVARNELKYVADVTTEFGELPPVFCNLADLNQVFLNLLVNAADAIAEVVNREGGRGEIRIRTSREGDTVNIAVSDTGGGIPEAIRPRIFEPFFTTKPVGKGTGQGLAITRTIVVEKHGGKITFEPNAPRGTTFRISLPIESARFTAADGILEVSTTSL